MPFWLVEKPLVLASKSPARRTLLEAAGIPVEVRPADLDERAVEAQASVTDPVTAAALLARAKAQTVAAKMPGRMLLGADQTLALDGRRFSKPQDKAAAGEQLRALRGRTHRLHSAVAIVRDGQTLFEHVSVAQLTMHAFSDIFLDNYLDAAGGAVTDSVGGYQLEGPGAQLFERIDGDYFTILGLPLLPLLKFLRQQGYTAK